MKKQLQIRIYPDGKIDAETLGIKGETCIDYMSVLEEILQARIVDSSYTEEYYQQEIHANTEINIQQVNQQE